MLGVTVTAIPPIVTTQSSGATVNVVGTGVSCRVILSILPSVGFASKYAAVSGTYAGACAMAVLPRPNVSSTIASFSSHVARRGVGGQSCPVVVMNNLREG